MAEQDDFKTPLLRRIRGYREAEMRVEATLSRVTEELSTLRSRREAAERLYLAEFGAVPDTEADAGDTQTQSTGVDKTAAPHQSRVGALTGLSWHDAIHKVLSSESPLHVKEIWRRLDAGGFRTGAMDPHRSIVTTAIRSPEIVRESPNTFGLAPARRSEKQQS